MDDPKIVDRSVSQPIPSKEQKLNNQNLTNQDNKLNFKQPYINKVNHRIVNGSNKLATKTVPLILKRSRHINDKSECPESNENIDENKERREIELNNAINDSSKDLVQRSSSRKKIKKSFGSDFLDLKDNQYSSSKILTGKKNRTKECVYCSKNSGEIHHCKYCRKRAHELCFQSNNGVSRDGYKNKVVICNECRNCEMCEGKSTDLYFCSRCSSVFHKSCDQNLINLEKPIFGEWQCSLCDNLDQLVGDSLTEEQRKKEIGRRKLIRLRKRMRKSDYVLEDGLHSIQQIVKQAVKKRKIENDDSDQNDKNKIELSEDELDNSKHILNETNQETDFWLEDESIDFIRMEDFLKKQRKQHNILLKQIKEDHKYFVLVKVFVDQLKDEMKFYCKKGDFLKVLNSDLFKRSFFEHNSLKGIEKSSLFLEGLTKCFEKCIQNEYFQYSTVHVDDNLINQSVYFANQVEKNELIMNEEEKIEITQQDDTEKDNHQSQINQPIVENIVRINSQKEEKNEIFNPNDLNNNSTLSDARKEPLQDDQGKTNLVVKENLNDETRGDQLNDEEFCDEEYCDDINSQEQRLLEELRCSEPYLDGIEDELEDELEDRKEESRKEKNKEEKEKNKEEKEKNKEEKEKNKEEKEKEVEKDELKMEILYNKTNEINPRINQTSIQSNNIKELKESSELNEENSNNDQTCETENSDQPVTVKDDLVKTDLLADNLVEEKILNDQVEGTNGKQINENSISKESENQDNNDNETNSNTNENEDDKDKNLEDNSNENQNKQEEQSTSKLKEENKELIIESEKTENNKNIQATSEPAISSNSKPHKNLTNKQNEESDDRSNDYVNNQNNKSHAESNKSSFSNSSNSSNSSSNTSSNGIKKIKSHNQKKQIKSTKSKKVHKPSTSKQNEKSKKQKVKIESSNNLVDKLFKRACKYNLNLLEPKYWTADDVSIYLKQIGFENEAQYFKEKSIDGKSLLKLSRQEVLTNFGIKLGRAVKIYCYIYDLQVKNKSVI